MRTEGERRLIASSIGERRASQEDVIRHCSASFIWSVVTET